MRHGYWICSASPYIYINENFTKKNFEIFRLARNLKSDGKVFQYHTANGRVFVKLNPDSQPIGITRKEHLNLLIENPAAQKQTKRKENNNNTRNLNKQSAQQIHQQPAHHSRFGRPNGKGTQLQPSTYPASTPDQHFCSKTSDIPSGETRHTNCRSQRAQHRPSFT